MIFDLSSPGRKRVVRVVFGFLALVFAIGFVGFGIGGEIGGGGIIDSITGNNEDAAADQFAQQIEDAEKAVEADPQNSPALAELAEFRVLSGEAQLQRDEATGAPIGLTDESRSEFEEAIAIWTRYADSDPARIDTATASRVVVAYRYLGDIGGAAGAQELLAESNPTAVNFAALADLLYRDFEIEAGDEARDRALEEANKEQGKLLERQLGSIRKQALAAKKAQSKQPDAPTGEGTGLGDPFGGLGPTDPGTGAPVQP